MIIQFERDIKDPYTLTYGRRYYQIDYYGQSSDMPYICGSYTFNRNGTYSYDDGPAYLENRDTFEQQYDYIVNHKGIDYYVYLGRGGPGYYTVADGNICLYHDESNQYNKAFYLDDDGYLVNSEDQYDRYQLIPS